MFLGLDVSVTAEGAHVKSSFFGDADASLLLAVKLDGLDFVGVWAGDVYAQAASSAAGSMPPSMA